MTSISGAATRSKHLRISSMTRLLYISPGPVPPSTEKANDQFSFLSEIAEGEVLLPIWGASQSDVAPHLRASFPVYRVGSFRYHFFPLYRYQEPMRRLARFFFYVREGLRLHYEKNFNVIMCYGTNLTGIAAVILKWITRAKLVVELPNVPEDAYRYQTPNAGIWATVKRFLANRLLNFVGKRADCIKLAYPWQLSEYPRLRNRKSAVFHFFTPVRLLGQPTDEKFVLLAGFPWYTKGADILIRAFKKISPRFPDYRLILLGHYPDRRDLNELIDESPNIEILKARPNEEALKVFSACSVYVLASRTEAMGRVLLEAMAARKPIIASAVGGVPYYIKDNDNGLLFESENVEELAARLSLMLSSPELRERLARSAHERVMSEFDEHSFVREFQRMLDSMGIGRTKEVPSVAAV